MNGSQIADSPFRVFAKIHPTQLGKPVRLVEGLDYSLGIAVNSKQQLVVAERNKKVTERARRCKQSHVKSFHVLLE